MKTRAERSERFVSMYSRIVAKLEAFAAEHTDHPVTLASLRCHIGDEIRRASQGIDKGRLGCAEYHGALCKLDAEVANMISRSEGLI